jgi:serine/threonine-protein kinase
LELPRVIGRYAVYDRIASGGMASVHLGRLLGPVGFARTVAVKCLHEQFAEDPEFVAMLLDEAKLAARINHPNVVQTLDVVAADKELFLVMEYVQGESLSRLVRQSESNGTRVTPAMAAAMVAGVLHGLHAAHEARGEDGEPLGIVHRDVSPQNVVVGIDGVARVLDFGIAKAAGRAQCTREGQVKGKLAYMAPEQIDGKVGRATDIYAASIVLWETLTGKRLFACYDPPGEVIRRVLEGCNVPPSRLVPDIPPALDELTMRGLATDPGRRPATALEMAIALEDCLPLMPTSRLGNWVQETAAETLKERRMRVAAIERQSAGLLPSSTAITKPDAAGPSEPDATIATQMWTEFALAPTGEFPDVAPQPKPWRTRAVAAAAFLALALAAFGGAGLRYRRTSEPAPSVNPDPAFAALATAAAASTSNAAPAVASTAFGSEEEALDAGLAGASPSSEGRQYGYSTPSRPSTEVPRSLSGPTVTSRDAPRASASTASTAPAASLGFPGRAFVPQASPRPPKQDCNPPYYFDASGYHHFKPECL